MSIKEQYKAELKKEQEIKDTENELKYYFRKRWVDLDCRGFYKLYAFVVNNKDNYAYVGALAENKDIKQVYYIKGYNKNKFIELNKNRDLLRNSGFLVLSYTTSHGIKLDIIYLPTKEPFCTFSTNGAASFNGYTFPKIENLQFCANLLEYKDTLDYGQEEVERVHTSVMQDTGDAKVINCSRLEDLEEGTELLITAIREIIYKKKTKYILKFENIKNKYISNYWLEKEIEDRCIDFNYKIKIKCDKLKTTPTKHKERMVFCV